MTFTAPGAFAGLVVLLIPFAIHLLQRGSGHQILVGTTRWLQEHERPRWRRLKITEPALLALRVLLLVLAVAILAAPVWFDRSSTPKDWVLLAPQLSPDEAAAFIEPPASAELRWLQAGFPRVGDEQPEPTTTDYWSLLADADRRVENNRQLTVIAPRDASYLGTKRLGLSRSILWHAVSIDDDKLAASAMFPDNVSVLYSPGREHDARFVAAAIDAWREVLSAGFEPAMLPVGSALPEPGDWLVYLGELGGGELPQDLLRWVSRGGTLLIDTQVASQFKWTVRELDDGGHPVVQYRRHGSGSIYRYGRPLVAEASVIQNNELPSALLRILAADKLVAPSGAYRLSEAQTIPRAATRATSVVAPAKSLITTLIPALLLLWALERLASAWADRRV